MPRFKLTVEYAGTRYSGWQIQKNARTVQGEIHRAIEALSTGKRFQTYGSGRTDAGVHALAQVAHLDLEREMPAAVLCRMINDRLPADINILSVEKVTHRFHARRSAVARSYLYQVSRRRTAFAKPYVWWIKDELDVGRMRKAAELFPGLRDFRSFTDEDPESTSTRVAVQSIEVFEKGDLILIRIQGSHFLWKMVRRIVGVLVEVGRGKLPAREVEAFLRSPSPVPARLTAPPSGLFLERVFYEGDCRELPKRAPIPVSHG